MNPLTLLSLLTPVNIKAVTELVQDSIKAIEKGFVGTSSEKKAEAITVFMIAYSFVKKLTVIPDLIDKTILTILPFLIDEIVDYYNKEGIFTKSNPIIVIPKA